ncbi:aquaglyceroporin Gla [Lactovum miscens]|uniref:Glycerol uptake facilitator protein n=1 Tax=Lactovum miscens TaxID=190387 RepID=A0A841C366_9LACT|nr:aquaglyceroporin Gla [Lactovum miscens]MBB5887273.1 glycerol uptake facilitator protein [Lactovum miscens]
MDYSWSIKYLTEFIGTALLIILGNGAVANVELKGTKAHGQTWMIIGWGYGVGVMLPALMFGNVSGNHINAGFTLGLAVAGLFPWAHVLPYLIAQLLGAIFGQLVVVAVYLPFYRKTENPNAILGSFSTIAAVDDGTKQTRVASLINGSANEFVGSFILFFGAMGLTKLFFGSETIPYLTQSYVSQGAKATDATVVMLSKQFAFPGLSIAHMALGFLVMVLVSSLGGPTGPGLNTGRDFGPRLVHWLLPKSVLGQAKGDSKWWYAPVPFLMPILAGIAAISLFKLIYL